MTVVVADTSPLNYLALIELIDVLPRLYGRVVIPHEVLSELTDPDAPSRVLEWARSLPDWIDVRHVPAAEDPALSHLDPGERSAIVVAQSEAAVLLLIDEAAGRLEAIRRGISNTGTLGVLRAAALAGIVDLPSALARLLATNFRVSTVLAEDLLAEDAERKHQGAE